MRDYELMVVLDPNLDETGIEGVTRRVESVVTGRDGRVTSTEAWGRRRLAYPIGRHRDGHYVLFRLNMNPTTTSELERQLRLTESVVRQLLVLAVENPRAAAHQQQREAANAVPAASAAPAAGAAAEPSPAPAPAPATA